ncbi:MAG: DUF6165 family protein [Candidatus Cloacimonetes bacterium]|nr:DUF6165 family protein [Candidatus Cloacimonadota bacterium]
MKIEISIGEVVDKVTILEIKKEKFRDVEKLKNVQKEYQLLKKYIEEAGIKNNSSEFLKLKEVNQKLWHIEDNIRIKESKGEFDDEFIQLARSVYFENDDRAAIKKEINLNFGSGLIEEKEYVNYKKS